MAMWRVCDTPFSMLDGSLPGRVRELLPVFDAAGFCKIPPPASKTIKPRS